MQKANLEQLSLPIANAMKEASQLSSEDSIVCTQDTDVVDEFTAAIRDLMDVFDAPAIEAGRDILKIYKENTESEETLGAVVTRQDYEAFGCPVDVADVIQNSELSASNELFPDMMTVDDDGSTVVLAYIDQQEICLSQDHFLPMEEDVDDVRVKMIRDTVGECEHASMFVVNYERPSGGRLATLFSMVIPSECTVSVTSLHGILEVA